MTMEDYDYEGTFKELKRSSQASLTMIILGALALIASLVYSGTRLAPLEEKINQKSIQIEKLARTEREYLEKIRIAKSRFEELKTNIEKLHAVRVTANNNVYELRATARATGRVTSRGPGYNFSIFVNAPNTTLNKIRKVTYVFDHPTFTRKTRTSEDASNQFMTKYYGWGCLTKVSATLELIDGESQQIEFNMCKSLGPLWWGEEDNITSSTDVGSVGKSEKIGPSRIDCGLHWTDWEEMSGIRGNPCPTGCYRGEVVNTETRQRYLVKTGPLGSPQKFPQRQIKTQFRCWRE